MVPAETAAQNQTVLETQIFLSEHGFNPGRPDGLWGLQTQRALRAFQDARGLVVSGEMDAQTLDAMGALLEQEARIDRQSGAEVMIRGPDEPAQINSDGFAQMPFLRPQPRPVISKIPTNLSGGHLPEDPAVTPTVASKFLPPTRKESGSGAGLWLGLAVVGLLWIRRPRIAKASKAEVIATQERLSAKKGRKYNGLKRPRKKPAIMVISAGKPKAERWSIAPQTVAAPQSKGFLVLDAAQRVKPTKPEPSAAQAPPKNTPHFRDLLKNKKPIISPKPMAVKTTVAHWVVKGKSVKVAGRKIGGMVYVGAAPWAGRYGQKCKAYIDPSLSVARVGDDYDGYGMPYWPSYAGIDARSRATYLAWLAGGRSDPRYNPGYLFLYFYGLERRFFVDNPTAQDRSDILAEAKRLLQAYGNNNSVRRYMSAFVEAANILVCSEADWQPIYENAGYELPLSLKAAIGTRLLAGKPLTADWALSWLLCDPETRLRTPAIRCRPEFMALFRQIFALKYPEGMKVRMPKRVLAPSYDAASGEFSVDLQISDTQKNLPDISGSRKPLNDARVIAEAAMDQLDKFSRYLGRTPEGRGTIEAYALLPASLWPLFPCAEVDALKAWVAGIIQRGRLVPLIDLIERLEKTRPQKANKKRIIGTADALARLGVGMAPDPRYALRSPKYDEPVVLFSLAEGHNELEMVSDAYRVALANLALATIIAQADGVVVEAEQAELVLFVRTAEGLTAPERMRLAANLKWFLAVPQNMSVLRARINAATAAQKQAFKRAALAMAHADKVVRPEEVSKIERLYKALGFDPKTIYSDLHGFSPPDAPVTMQAATMGAPGVPIPPEGAALDHGRIREIMADTSRVAAVLGGIFSYEEEDGEDTAPAPGLLEGLPAKYQAFVAEMITRAHGPDTDFDSLVIRYKLMASGCLEVVNEWAFGAFDDVLIDEYDGYEISPDIAAALKTEAEQER